MSEGRIIKHNKIEGIKLDNGKPLPGDMITIFHRTLIKIGELIAKGAIKYPQTDNWQYVDNAKKRYLNALMRHLLSHISGKEIDEETKLPHLVAVAWNALAICELYLIDKKEGETNE